MISQDAIFVLESYNGAETWNILAQQPFYQTLITFPAFQKFSSQIASLDSLTGGYGKLARSTTGKQMTISLHPTGLESFDLLFSVNLNPETTANLINEIKRRLIPGSRFQSRKYSNIEILEYYDLQNNKIWSMALLNQQVLASPSSFLLEEAIRFYLSENPESYYSLTKANPLELNHNARLMISSKGIYSLLKGVLQDQENLELKAFENSDEGLVFNMSFEENQLVFKGDLITTKGINFSPSIRSDLSAIESIISNSTLALTQYNLTSFFETQKFSNLSFAPKTTFSGDIQRSLLDKGFYDALTGEIYLLNLADTGVETNNSAILIRTNNPTASFELLNAYQKDIISEESDFYLGNKILHLLEKDFPAHLFAGKFTGFDQSFITVLEEIIVITNSQEAMKIIIDDQISGNTWLKLPKNTNANRSLSATSGFGKIILVDQIWKKWTRNSNPSWSSFLQKYSSSFRSFPFVSLSINQINARAEATLIIQYQPDTPYSETNPNTILLKPSNSISFPKPLIYGPKSIINFQDLTEDIIIQDDQDILYLINSGGEQVFATQLDNPIVSDVFQVDYYKNGKLQMLLATQSKIYGIDRLGNALPGYPIGIKDEQITHLNLLDYSNNKEYRYFVSTQRGNLYLIDKKGNLLEGWNPLQIGEKTITPPEHIRIPAKGDVLIAQTDEGNLHLFTRRGEKYPNSPFQLKNKQTSPLFFKYDPTTKNPLFIGINLLGQIAHYDINGQITYKNQLIREEKENEFTMIKNQNQTGFIFVSRQYNQITVLDKSEQFLFKINISNQNLIFQYFDFGSNRQIFAVTDLEQNFCYLYDFEGNLMTTMPLESTQPILITHQATLGQFLIRTINNNKLTEFQLAH